MKIDIGRQLHAVAHSHPFIWRVAWEAMRRIPRAVHDPTYRALRHFVVRDPEGMFLDIGANNGISAKVFRDMAPNAPILSIEPNEMLTSSLKRLARADAKFTYRVAAVGDSHGTLRIHVPSFHGVCLHTWAASDPERVITGIRADFGERVAHALRLIPVDAEIVRVDDLSVSPAIMKVDAEGCELSILTGARLTLQRSRPFLMVELVGPDRDEIDALLRSLGYVMRSYNVGTDDFGPFVEGQRNYFGFPEERWVP